MNNCPQSQDKKVSSMEGENNEVSYRASSVQGKRDMEDAFFVNCGLESNSHLFGVFDGYAGCEVAEYVKQHFSEMLVQSKAFEEKKYAEALKDAFLQLDVDLKTEQGRSSLFEICKDKKSQKKEEALTEEQTQLNIFQSIFDPRSLKDCNIAQFSGCTASVCLIVDSLLFIAHVGDSRVKVIENFNEIYETVNHYPKVKEEEERILKANGAIEDNRINGIIGLSRSIGLFDYKKGTCLKPNQQMIIAEPEVKEFSLSKVDYVLMGTNGLWNMKDFSALAFIENDANDYSKVFEEISSKRDKQKMKDDITFIAIKIKPQAKVIHAKQSNTSEQVESNSLEPPNGGSIN